MLIYPPTTNGLQKTLGAALDQGITASATLNNVTGIQNKKGLMIINRIDTNGAELDASLREYITFAGTSGSTVVTLTRGLGGTTDQDHAIGSVVEFVFDVVQMQAILDALDGTSTDLVLNTPKLLTGINDTNGNELLKITATGSAVNEVTLANAATGNGPTISATGGDTDIDINITPKGTGKVSQGKTQFTTQAYFDAEIDDGNSGTSDTIDWTTGNKHKSTVTGDVTYTFTAPSGPCNLILKLVNGGAHTPVWPDTVLWSGGEEPAWTASGTDIVAMYWDGTNYYSQASLDFS